MANRMIKGKLATGDYGVRVSLPGFDVASEGFGSRNISFDSRITEIGTVIQSGLIQCGGGAISFPSMGYTPICAINRYDGNLYSKNDFFYVPAGGVASQHTWFPAIAIISPSTIQVVAYTNSNWNTLGLYNPNGQYYLYTIFANGG